LVLPQVPTRSRAQISNHGRPSTQALLLLKAQLQFFHSLEIVTGWLVPSTQEGHARDHVSSGSYESSKYKGKIQALLYSMR